ncbi:MAG: hypothetical protein IJ305_06450 [Oscillospiraceae bacterium]|nr:hypothetical protein [Oscillospiraceae bacterium]
MLKSARPFLSQAASIIERAAEQESDCLDNMPENLQDTDRYEKMEKAVENLEAALEHIENAQDCLSEAIA